MARIERTVICSPLRREPTADPVDQPPEILARKNSGEKTGYVYAIGSEVARGVLGTITGRHKPTGRLRGHSPSVARKRKTSTPSVKQRCVNGGAKPMTLRVVRTSDGTLSTEIGPGESASICSIMTAASASLFGDQYGR
jgi:hypothetical protein